MATFTPRQRNDIYNELVAHMLAFTPITSSELGEVIDNLCFCLADQLYEAYIQMQNSLELVKLTTITGQDLDNVAAEYPNLIPRFAATNGSGLAQVTDPNVTKKYSAISTGGATHGNTFVNINDPSTFPASGFALIGTRGSSSFETFQYTSKSGFQLLSTLDTLTYDHGTGESVVLSTVGDRTFSGPFSLTTQATSLVPAKIYTSTTSLTIYDGEASGSMSIEASVAGLNGNTPSNTITTFVGSVPFPGATVTNSAKISNALADEADADFRERIRRERQALSSANIDAVTATLLGINFEGQIIDFVQVSEDADPTLPSLIYIDDGSGFIPPEGDITSPIVLEDIALGSETVFRIPMKYLPILTTSVENVSRVFSNITVQLNGVTLVQGDAANEYRVHPESGVVKLMTPLVSGDHLEITALKYYSGLISLANQYLYGDYSDRTNYPGVVGLGQWVQIRTPLSVFINITGNVTLDGTRSLDDVIADIKSQFLDYVNNAGIGVTILVNRLMSLAFVQGVKNFSITSPSADIIIPIGSLARTTTGSITIN